MHMLWQKLPPVEITRSTVPGAPCCATVKGEPCIAHNRLKHRQSTLAIIGNHPGSKEGRQLQQVVCCS